MRLASSQRALPILLTCLIGLSGGTAAAQRNLPAEEHLETVLEIFVLEELKPWLQMQDPRDIVVGDIVSPATSSASAWVRDQLYEQAKDAGIEVKDLRATFTMHGEYRALRESGKLRVAIDFWVRDEDSNEVKRFDPRVIEDRPEIAKLLGLTEESAVADDDEDASNATSDFTSTSSAEQLETVTAKIDGSAIFSGQQRDYGVELLVKRGGEYVALRPDLVDGFAFVGLSPDDVYGVRLINDTDDMAAVDLSIDGFSYFRFQESTRFTHVIIHPHTRPVIKGWFISNAQAREFLVKSLSNVAGAEISPGTLRQSDRNRIGTITALFHRARKGGGVRSLFTDQGKQVSAKYDTVRATWDKTHVAAVSIRYHRK